MLRAAGIFSISSFVGLLAAGAAWIAALAVVGTDETLVVRDFEIDWAMAISIATAIVVIGVLIAMHSVVEPILTALAATAGAVLLYNVRELPFGTGNEGLATVDNEYWAIVGMMVIIFTLLILSLRAVRGDGGRRR